LETSRLTLVPCSLELAEVLADRAAAEKQLGVAVPEGWPDDELAGLLELYSGWLRADPTVLGYGPWIVIVREERAVVGSAGFVGRPKAGELESVTGSPRTTETGATRRRRPRLSSNGGSPSQRWSA
jgi:hypothetical protein